jgi:hypothetical protein
VDADVAATDSPARVLMIQAREDLEIAGQVRRLLEPPGSVG